MDPALVGYISVGVLIVTLLIGMPIGIGMLLVAFSGLVYVLGWDAAFGYLRTVPFNRATSYGMAAIPLFMLMGAFCYHGKLSTDLYYTAYKWLGQIRGGLGMATIAACAGFATVSASSLATALSMTTVALPEMRKYKYSDTVAAGCLAAGGTLGSLIPPSVVMIIYGIITEQSIGKLFLAAFIPGFLLAGMYCLTTFTICSISPSKGPRGPKTSVREKVVSLRYVWSTLVLLSLILGGIYLGVFTPNEAGAVGASGALLLCIIRRTLSWKQFIQSGIEAAKFIGSLIVLTTGAITFGYLLVACRTPFQLVDFLSELAVNKYVFISMITLLYMILGCFMDSICMMLITLPVLYPVILSAGFDPIWFGVYMVEMAEIGLITPPVGLNVFMVYGAAKDIPMDTIFKGVVPYLVTDLVWIAVIVLFPQIVLVLPNLMR